MHVQTTSEGPNLDMHLRSDEPSDLYQHFKEQTVKEGLGGFSCDTRGYPHWNILCITVIFKGSKQHMQLPQRHHTYQLPIPLF